MGSDADRALLPKVGTDPRAFEEFYRRHVHEVVAFAAHRCRTPEEAADLVAATFVAVIESAARYEPGRGEPVAWLLGIAANVHAGRRRRERRERAAIVRLSGQRLLDADDHARLEEMIDASRLAPKVAHAVAELPASQREIVELLGEGLAPVEAARILRISPATARMRLTRARRTLHRALSADDPSPCDLAPVLKEEES